MAPRVVPAPCASKVELRLSCRHLLDRDPLTKSDPSVVLLLQAQGQWVQVGGGAGGAETQGLEMVAGAGRSVRELGCTGGGGVHGSGGVHGVVVNRAREWAPGAEGAWRGWTGRGSGRPSSRTERGR